MPKRSLPPLPEWYPRGTALLRDPTLNKGTAFSDHERDVLGLRGLLPPHVATQDEQLARVLENFHRLQTPLRALWQHPFTKSDTFFARDPYRFGATRRERVHARVPDDRFIERLQRGGCFLVVHQPVNRLLR